MQHTSKCPTNYRKTILATLLTALTLTISAQLASAQSFNVIYNFTGHADGSNPTAGVTLDRAGNLYGTAAAGGSLNCNFQGLAGCGTVYELAHGRSGWTFMPIHGFTGTPDGANPAARVVFGNGGLLYGTTAQGGTQGYGTVFQLLPPVHICTSPSCPWFENVLHDFQNPYGDGVAPGSGDVVFDSHGNLWGTTVEGGGYLCDDSPCGTAYELSQGSWAETVYYIFSGLGFAPYAGLVGDGAGKFYGTFTALAGGIYQAPSGDVLYSFSQAASPLGGLSLDSSGTLLYGTTSQGGAGGGGTVFAYSLSTATLTTLYSFSGPNQQGAGPTATLLMDSQGNLYGTTRLDGAHGQGSLFKLTQSNGVWTLTTLHDFTGGADGGQPYGQLIMDANGNLYGTTTVGGSSVGHCYLGLGCGVVFEITP